MCVYVINFIVFQCLASVMSHSSNACGIHGKDRRESDYTDSNVHFGRRMQLSGSFNLQVNKLFPWAGCCSTNDGSGSAFFADRSRIVRECPNIFGQKSVGTAHPLKF